MKSTRGLGGLFPPFRKKKTYESSTLGTGGARVKVFERIYHTYIIMCACNPSGGSDDSKDERLCRDERACRELGKINTRFSEASVAGGSGRTMVHASGRVATAYIYIYKVYKVDPNNTPTYHATLGPSCFSDAAGWTRLISFVPDAAVRLYIPRYIYLRLYGLRVDET